MDTLTVQVVAMAKIGSFSHVHLHFCTSCQCTVSWLGRKALWKSISLALAYIYIPAEGSKAPPGSYSSKDGRDVERLSAVR